MYVQPSRQFLNIFFVFSIVMGIFHAVENVGEAQSHPHQCPDPRIMHWVEEAHGCLCIDQTRMPINNRCVLPNGSPEDLRNCQTIGGFRISDGQCWCKGAYGNFGIPLPLNTRDPNCTARVQTEIQARENSNNSGAAGTPRPRWQRPPSTGNSR